MSLSGWTIETPEAPFSVVQDRDVVVASGFCGLDELVERLSEGSGAVERVVPTGTVVAAVRAYVGGDSAALDEVEVRQPGGEFQQEVWRVMREIPGGETWSYAELATKAGRPTASRAAGTACARNLVAPFVPCHRVVRSDGSLGGYAFGLDVKRWLLSLEVDSAG
ncbi:MAG: methylated-DNA--[protein]-cysteine S-methyltransferase [Actinomycetes bacterium]|jgi:methylated-DNA-[protein]-cysteine S-methyltransferase|nr:methylated-DNA--[protein]-cysteine S-methyltransferase [Actinomycetes bacterium]